MFIPIVNSNIPNQLQIISMIRYSYQILKVWYFCIHGMKLWRYFIIKFLSCFLFFLLWKMTRSRIIFSKIIFQISSIDVSSQHNLVWYSYKTNMKSHHRKFPGRWKENFILTDNYNIYMPKSILHNLKNCILYRRIFFLLPWNSIIFSDMSHGH